MTTSEDRRWRRLLVAWALSLCCWPPGAWADTATGIAWLMGQQQADGSFHSQATQATPLQATAEAIVTLAAESATHAEPLRRAIGFLALAGGSNAEYLSRQILALRATAGDASSLLSRLESMRVGAGTALTSEHQPSVLDTSLALLAPGPAPVPGQRVAVPGLAHLLAQQAADGSWSSGSSPAHGYATSMAVLSLQRYRPIPEASAALDRATTFLLSTQRPQGGWGSTVDTALALLALVPQVPDGSRYAAAAQALQAGQAASGAWDDDVFATALALRALALVRTATLPGGRDQASVSGIAVDASTGAGLAGVTVSLSGAAERVLSSDATGRFQAGGLPSGAYTLQLQKPGYPAAVFSLQLAAGQQHELGSVRLPLGTGTALVSGVVKGIQAGPLAGASVQAVSGAATLSTSTAADGSYSLSVPPGTLSLVVSAAGHLAATGAGSAVAGQRLEFSPVLRLAVQGGPPGRITLSGVLLDARSSAPVAQARVSLPSLGVTATSDAAGAWSLESPQAGDLPLQITHEGYATLARQVLVAENTATEVGVIRLEPLGVPATTVSGKVLDTESGRGIASARVTIGGSSAVTAADGSYSLSGIQASTLAFEVSASATGYASGSLRVAMQAPGVSTVDLRLQRAATGGLQLTDVRLDRPSYGAYAEASLQATLRNTSQRPRIVRLRLKVLDAAGAVLEDLPALAPGREGEPVEARVEAGGEQRAALAWRTGGRAAGEYRMVVQAFDAQDSTLLSELAVPITITESREVELLVLRPEPAYLQQGTTAEVAVRAQVLHSSNVAGTLTVAWALLTPAGQLVQGGTGQIAIEPGAPQASVQLGSFQHLFLASGEYALQIESVEGGSAKTKQGWPLYVAGDVRVEIEQGLSPATVVPDGDKEIKLHIRIRGVAK